MFSLDTLIETEVDAQPKEGGIVAQQAARTSECLLSADQYENCLIALIDFKRAADSIEAGRELEEFHKEAEKVWNS